MSALRVTENRCVVFNFSTYVCFALLPQHCALYAKVDRTSICIYIYIYQVKRGQGRTTGVAGKADKEVAIPSTLGADKVNGGLSA